MPWLLAIQRKEKKTTKKEKQKEKKQTKVQKAWFHHEEKYQLWIPGWVWGPGARGKDGCCVKRKPRPSCFSASGKHEHRPKKHTAAIHFGLTWKPQCRWQFWIFFLLKVFFLFLHLYRLRPKKTKTKPYSVNKTETRKVTKALLWGVMGKN